MKKELRDTLRKELNSIFYEYFNYELEDIIKESFNESKSSRDKRQLARDLFKVTRDEMVRRGSLHFNFNPEIDLKVTIVNVNSKSKAKFSPPNKTIALTVFPAMVKEYNERNIGAILDYYEGLLIHEFIHFLDYEYISKKPYENGYKDLDADTPEYYKHEMESEAYFHSIANVFEIWNSELQSLEDFYKKFGDDIQQFRKLFWDIAEKSLKEKGFNVYKHFKDNKWEAKIYKLYFELKSKFDKDAEQMLECILADK